MLAVSLNKATKNNFPLQMSHFLKQKGEKKKGKNQQGKFFD